jgi:hypothetical protein
MPALRDPALRARITQVTPLLSVRAGSALLAVRGRLLVVQDDALAVAWVDPDTYAIEHVAIEGAGGPLVKAHKPDFEAAFLDHEGRVVVVGSGSTAVRRRAARLDPTTHAVALEDWGPLYDALAEALGITPNIEGAVRDGATLVLLHRGAGAGSSARCRVALDAAGHPHGRPDVTWHALGAVDGVPLHFTDAAAVGDALVYLAAAEDTTNAIDDGRVAGAAIGELRAGEARFAILEEPDGTPSTRKVEGIALLDGGREAFVVTDADDVTQPAELCRVELVGFPTG